MPFMFFRRIRILTVKAIDVEGAEVAVVIEAEGKYGCRTFAYSKFTLFCM